MPARLLLLAALIGLAGCHSSRDKDPTPDDPTPTSPTIRLDTATVHVKAPATNPN